MELYAKIVDNQITEVSSGIGTSGTWVTVEGYQGEDQTLTYDATNEQNVTVGDFPNNSRYVRVSAVNTKMPDYLDPAGTPKPEFAKLMPLAGSGDRRQPICGTPFLLGARDCSLVG